MNFSEIRTVKYLVETARSLKEIEPGWAWENWTAFQMVMLRQARPKGTEFEITDKQYTNCLHAAWQEVNHDH